MKSLVYILLFMSAIVFGQSNTLFEQGNRLYNEGKYQDAINSYKMILEHGEHSAELYYNLANAHYKLNHIGPSIYYYEKALQLNPHDPEILNNASFARKMTVDAIEVIPEVGLTRIIKNITNSYSFDTWAIMTVTFVFVFVILFLCYYFSYGSNSKRILFVSSLVSIVLALMTLGFAFKKFDLDKIDQPAIVFAKESRIMTEPNLRSEEAFRLHEGTKVQILETLEGWKKIKLSNGEMGWITEDDIRRVRNF
ncbi:MAG: tetratricopeptide repeat protein [Flavobacteriaceae bacterium]|nr:tetratricopeptide repeat protein [Flavobacteriaceae bacterium]